jgi:diacylglycerol O-acyltransferase / wax synthase
MQQLSGLDAAFLALDSPTSTGHVGGVHVFEAVGAAGAGPLTLDRLTALIGERISLLPPLRRRVVAVPLGLDQPYWIEDAGFDLEFHVRELALPAPGSMRQLTEQVARIHSRQLDRGRPLWEVYLIDGLEGDRQAVYAKLHHAMIDGVAGQEVTTALLDLSPDGRDIPPSPPWSPDPVPGAVVLLTRAAVSLTLQPRRAARFAVGLARSSPGWLGRLAATALPGIGRLIGEDAGVLFAAPVLAPATPFNRSVGPHRRVAFADVPLATVKAVKSAAGVTVNDVVLALAAGALRRWLLLHGALPEGPLVAAVPISVRSGGGSGLNSLGDGALGNKVSLMLAALPTHLDDPRARLQLAHQATTLAKEQHQALPADLLANAYDFAMPALLGLATRASARLRLLERVNLFNLFVSNVPGPPVPLFLAGHRVLASYPVSAITDGQGLNITVVSYLDALHFGLIADRALIPDLELIGGFLVEELDALSAAVGTAPGRPHRSAATQRSSRARPAAPESGRGHRG